MHGGGGARTWTIVSVTLLILASFLALHSVPSRHSVPPEIPLSVRASPTPGAFFDYVVILVMENRGICDILTYCGGEATYMTELANASGLATEYGYCGTSLLDYLCLTGASTFGCTGSDDPNSSECTAVAWQSINIVDRFVEANITWKAYMENMTFNCQGTNDGGYAVRHDPFAYYGDVVTNTTRCAQVVPAGDGDSVLLNDLASPSTAPNYMWLTPNLCNDMDRCSTRTGDAYLASLVPQILTSAVFTTERAALFITFDEPSGSGSPNLYTIWAGPVAKANYTSAVPYEHFSLLSTLEANWNLTPLNENDTNAPDMAEFFIGPGPNFFLSAFPWSVAFLSGTNATSTIRVTETNGFNGKVDLHETSDPEGVDATCEPPFLHRGDSSTCTMTGSTTGSYDVNVAGTSDGLVNNVTIQVHVYVLLGARFSFSPSAPVAGQPVNLTGIPSGGVPFYNYSWEFGDGGSAFGKRVSHVFPANGTYQVNLTLHDSIGLTANSSGMITVLPAPLPLSATLTVSPASPTVGQDILFAATASGGVPPYSYGWEFGDGATGNGRTPHHLYAAAGSYEVNLTVSDSKGNSSTATQRVSVAPPRPPGSPSSTLQAAGSVGNAGWYVTDVVVILSATDPAGPAVWVDYRVDGSAWKNYTEAFTLHDGTHLLEYRASDAYGAQPEAIHSATFNVDTLPPELTFEAMPVIVSTSHVTIRWTATDAESGIAGYAVQVDGAPFQDLGVSSEVSLNLGEGPHTITVRASDVAGNAATASITFRIDTNPLSLSGPFGWALPYLLLLLLILVAAGLVLWYRRRRHRPS